MPCVKRWLSVEELPRCLDVDECGIRLEDVADLHLVGPAVEHELLVEAKTPDCFCRLEVVSRLVCTRVGVGQPGEARECFDIGVDPGLVIQVNPEPLSSGKDIE